MKNHRKGEKRWALWPSHAIKPRRGIGRTENSYWEISHSQAVWVLLHCWLNSRQHSADEGWSTARLQVSESNYVEIECTNGFVSPALNHFSHCPSRTHVAASAPDCHALVFLCKIHIAQLAKGGCSHRLTSKATLMASQGWCRCSPSQFTSTEVLHTYSHAGTVHCCCQLLPPSAKPRFNQIFQYR